MENIWQIENIWRRTHTQTRNKIEGTNYKSENQECSKTGTLNGDYLKIEGSNDGNNESQ